MNNKTFSQKAIRHGEILVAPIDAIPEGAVEVYTGQQYVIGHSETGHHHLALAGTGTISIFKPAGADDGSLFMRVTGKGARVHHQKTFDRHADFDLRSGIYQVTVKKSYDYFAKLMRRVMD